MKSDALRDAYLDQAALESPVDLSRGRHTSITNAAAAGVAPAGADGAGRTLRLQDEQGCIDLAGETFREEAELLEERLLGQKSGRSSARVADNENVTRELTRTRVGPATPGNAEPTVVAAGPEGVWAGNSDAARVYRLDPRTGKVAARVPTTSGAYCAARRRPTTPIAKGLHVFRVRTRDAAGNVDPTPAVRSWRIR